MTAIRISPFGGMVPRLTARNLPDGSARIAANCSFASGDLTPMRMSQPVFSPAAEGTAVLSMFRVDNSTWFSWPKAFVSMVRSPLEGVAKYIFTGDGIPKVTTLSMALPVSPAGSPASARALGIPSPVAAPALSASGGTGAAVTRFYCYTFVSDWEEESGPSPVSAQITGKVDSTWALSGMDASPPNSAAITSATHSAGVVTVSMSGNTYLRVGDQVSIAAVVGMSDLNGVWEVTGLPAANKFTVALTTAQTYTSGGTWSRVNQWGACTKRIYRTDGTKSSFQLVAEGVSASSYNDTIFAVNIPGDSLITQNWMPPPTNITGLISLENGMLAAFYDNIVCLCEPYQPHAWPEAYRFKMSDFIVGLAAFDSNVAVATTGRPVVLSGVDPEHMTPTRHATPLPCMSRASVSGIGDSAVYATKDGIARIDLSGASVFTTPLFSRENWHELEPSTIRCAYDGGRLFVCSSHNKQVFIMNLQDGMGMSVAYNGVNAAYVDQQSGYFYFSADGHIYEFDVVDGVPLTMDWWSREYVLAKPANLGAARVEFDPEYAANVQAALDAYRASLIAANQSIMSTSGGGGAIGRRVISAIDVNGSDLQAIPDSTLRITFSFYAGDQLMLTKEVTDQECFRLPSGYKAGSFSVRMQANTQIRSIAVADTPARLADV